MPGSAQISPYDVPLWANAVPVVVCRYDRDAPADARYSLLPNVRCRQVQYREGAQPPTARFEYVFDDSDPDSPFPTQFEQVWPITASGHYVVQNDDKLVVLGYTDSGEKRVLWHGMAQIPQVDLSSSHQSVTFVGVHGSVRLWDLVVGGRIQRNADVPNSADPADQIGTALPTRFNPDKESNCTPDNQDVMGDTPSRAYPVFLDEGLKLSPDPRTSWTLGKMVRYLLSIYNDEEYVKNPDFTDCDSFLQSYKPTSGQFYDPSNPSTYTKSPIVLRDYDCTNDAVIDAIWRQLQYHQFGFRFSTDTDVDGNPLEGMWFYRKDAGNVRAPKQLSLQALGAALDPGRSNVSELHVTRDLQAVANAFAVETDPVRYEISVILAPLFTISAADATNFLNFNQAAIVGADADTRKKYRVYGVDEVGEGHWNFQTSATDNTAFDFAPVFGTTDDGSPKFVKRLRPAETTLITVDDKGKPRNAVLEISTNYTGPQPPCFWDGVSGTDWRRVGEWQLLKDRLGIACTSDNPEGWKIPTATTATTKVQGQKISGVTAMASPTTTNPRFYLRLTCVVTSDQMISAYAGKRAASPTIFTIARRVDAKDHFKKEIVGRRSLYNTSGADQVKRDDTANAQAHAEALRAAHEFPALAGSVRIPRLVNSYNVGDRIDVIEGRDVSLQVNVGASQGEGAAYPYVVGLTWDFAGNQQSTTLELSDHRAEPQRA